MTTFSKGKIDQAYMGLIGSFQKAAQAAGSYQVRRANNLGFVSRITKEKLLMVTSNLYLPDWKYRSSATTKRINIFIRGAEVFDFISGLIVKSTIQVMYLEIADELATPLLALHYDFEEPVLPGHPCFHVQMGVTDVSPQECREVGLRAAIMEPSTPCYPSIRIATPHMSLGAVLTGIAADHLPTAFSKQFITQVRTNFLKDCECSCLVLSENIASHGGANWHSHHWYDVR